tara:strand:- start:319 stop:876 length:558 start_codon:yes stop_codon:yes gene_type:complete
MRHFRHVLATSTFEQFTRNKINDSTPLEAMKFALGKVQRILGYRVSTATLHYIDPRIIYILSGYNYRIFIDIYAPFPFLTAYDELDTVANGNAHIVFSDPPYGMKSGGHTYCNMSKSLSEAYVKYYMHVEKNMKKKKVKKAKWLFWKKLGKNLILFICGRLKIYALEDEIFYTKPIDIVIDILVF